MTDPWKQDWRDKEEITRTFCELSGRIGKERVIWRYDPIILNDVYSPEYHREQFSRLCSRLGRYADQCVISFVDKYPKLRTDAIREISMDEMAEIGRMISSVAGDFGVTVKACCEGSFLQAYGIGQAHCIDKTLIEKICGYSFSIKKTGISVIPVDVMKVLTLARTIRAGMAAYTATPTSAMCPQLTMSRGTTRRVNY